MSVKKKIDKNGKPYYQIRVEYGYDNYGKRKRKYGTAHTKKEADILNAEMIKKYYHKSKQVNLNDLTFEEYSNYFIKTYCEPNIGKVTIKNYKQMLNSILPLIGEYKLNKINTVMLDNLYLKLKIGKKGNELSPKTMSHYYNLISIMFKQAKKWKLIDNNPNEDTIKPKLTKSKRHFYNIEQVNDLFKCLEKENIKYKTIISLGLKSGIRRGELCALRWNDIDFANKTMLIDNSLKVVNGEVDEKRAKTEYSIRKLDLSDKTIKLLQEYKKWQDTYIADKGDKWLGTNRIFTAINGKHIHPDTINDILQRIIKKYNLPKITFHELRHTYATILNDSGKSAKTICELLGHADASITLNTYTHTIEATKKECANVFDNLLNMSNNR